MDRWIKSYRTQGQMKYSMREREKQLYRGHDKRSEIWMCFLASWQDLFNYNYQPSLIFLHFCLSLQRARESHQSSLVIYSLPIHSSLRNRCSDLFHLLTVSLYCTVREGFLRALFANITIFAGRVNWCKCSERRDKQQPQYVMGDASGSRTVVRGPWGACWKS